MTPEKIIIAHLRMTATRHPEKTVEEALSEADDLMAELDKSTLPTNTEATRVRLIREGAAKRHSSFVNAKVKRGG